MTTLYSYNVRFINTLTTAIIIQYDLKKKQLWGSNEKTQFNLTECPRLLLFNNQQKSIKFSSNIQEV